MNRSSRKAHEATASGFGGARGNCCMHLQTAGHGRPARLQLLVAPNGVLVWTAAAQVGSQPYAGEVFATRKSQRHA